MKLLLRSVLVAAPAAAVAAGALTLAAGPAVTTASPARTAHSAYHVPSARFVAEGRAALVRYLRNHRPLIQLVHPSRVHPGVKGTTKAASFNWSGYADTSTTHGEFTAVSGTWTTPAVKCGAEDQLSVQWVGLDGYASSTVEQDGTFGWCYRGKALYFTWYEMFPATPIVEVGTTLAPGDKISASVSRKGTAYTLKLTDSTHSANSFTKSRTCAATTCIDTSAEWIAERPAFQIGIAPLSNFSKWSLTSGKETAGGKSGTIGSFASNVAITMIDATQAYALSTPSALSGGSSFSATWHNSY